MADELVDTVTKVGGGMLGGASIVGILLKMVHSNLEREVAELRAQVEHLRERLDKSSEVRNSQLSAHETRIGRLEGRQGLIGDGATDVK